jgi:hypothetical protein
MLIDVPITVIINVITLLRGGRATGPTLITDTLVDHPITVIVNEVTDLRLRLNIRHTASASCDT